MSVAASHFGSSNWLKLRRASISLAMSASSESFVAAIDGANRAIQHFIALHSGSEGNPLTPSQLTSLQSLTISRVELANVLEKLRIRLRDSGVSMQSGSTPFVYKVFCGIVPAAAVSQICSWLGLCSLAYLQASCKAIRRADMFLSGRNKFAIATHCGATCVPPSLLSWTAAFECGAKLAISWGMPTEVDNKLKEFNEDRVPSALCVVRYQAFVGPPVAISVAALLQVVGGRLASSSGIARALELLHDLALDFPEACQCMRMTGGVRILLELIETTKGITQLESAKCLAAISFSVDF